MTELHRTIAEHAHDGRWIDLLCGLGRMASRFDALLAQYAPPEASPAEETSSAVVEFVLGMIAIRDRITMIMDEQEREPAEHEPANPPRGSLLR